MEEEKKRFLCEFEENGAEEDTFSNRRIHPIFRPPLTIYDVFRDILHDGVKFMPNISLVATSEACDSKNVAFARYRPSVTRS